jgi:hypothetical protein
MVCPIRVINPQLSILFTLSIAMFLQGSNCFAQDPSWQKSMEEARNARMVGNYVIMSMLQRRTGRRSLKQRVSVHQTTD